MNESLAKNRQEDTSVKKLETGYCPTAAVLSEEHKKRVFKEFSEARLTFKLLPLIRQRCEDRLELCEQAEEYAKEEGDLTLLRNAIKWAERIQDFRDTLEGLPRDLVSYMLSLSRLIEVAATLEEKASLLGITPTAARRELSRYPEVSGQPCESFLCLLTHMPEDRTEPYEVLARYIMIEQLSANPVTNRAMTQDLNDFFGREVFPLPKVQKPVGVPTRPSLA
jgi:hypothetical protein